MTNDQRLRNIDFLRAFSILIVMFYHFRPFEGGELFKNGYYGVLLFFMISGYCIQYSVQSSRHFLDFLVKRWIRLMPALVFVSLAIWFLKLIGANYNLKDHYLYDFADIFKMSLNLPFIDLPFKVINKIFHTNFSYGVPDTAYWSLIVEFQFYYVQALLLMLPRKRMILWQVLILILFTYFQIKDVRHNNVFFEVGYFYPYFLFGISMALQNLRQRLTLIVFSVISVIVMTASNVSNPSIPFVLAPTLFMSVLFLLSLMYSNVFSRWGGWLQTVGIVSYPLYLIHQHIGQKFLNFLNHYSNPSVFKVLFVVFALFCFAWLVNRYIENPIQKWIKGRIR